MGAALILLAVWKNFGYNMIIFLAGLQNINTELVEAASIDGAGAWTAVTNSVALQTNKEASVLVTPERARQFFRLRR